MTRFGIQKSALTDQIHIGLLDPHGSRFLDGSDIIDDGELHPGMDDVLTDLRHEDHTDRALRVVADYVLEHFGGAMVVDYKDGSTYGISITRTVDVTARPI